MSGQYGSRTVAAASVVGVPALIADAGEHATRGFPEFFAAIMARTNETAFWYA